MNLSQRAQEVRNEMLKVLVTRNSFLFSSMVELGRSFVDFDDTNDLYQILSYHERITGYPTVATAIVGEDRFEAYIKHNRLVVSFN